MTFRRLLAGCGRRLRPRRIAATARWLTTVVAAVRRRRREPRLTVAVDICALWEPLAGVGWYLFRILESLAARDDVRLRLYGPHLPVGGGFPEPLVPPPAGPALEWVHQRPPDDLSLPAPALGWLLQKLQKILVAADGNRVILAPNYLVPPHFRFARGAVVATVHDLGCRRIPWALEEGTLAALTAQLEATLARCRWVITVSQTVRRELLELGLAPPQRIVAVPEGPGQLATVVAGELPPGLPADYALHVGTLEPRKNLELLLAVWELRRRQGVRPPLLVLVGRPGWKAEALLERLAVGQREGWIELLGYVDNPTLAALYRHARYVLFPTLYEGFGLPALEAQQAGAPLVASDIPVLREVAGDGALFAPLDRPAIWAERLQQLEEDPPLRQRLVDSGRRNVARYCWQRTATEVLAVLRRAAALNG